MSELANVVPLEGVGKRRVDYTRGSHSGVVSSQWFQRPDDQRFLNLEDLYAAVKRRAEDSWVMTQETRQLRVLAKVDDPTTLLLEADGGQIISPTNWSFGQICQQIRCPAPFLSELPAAIAAVPLQHRLMTFRGEVVKLFGAGAQDDVKELRASTSPSYGRIYDHEVVCSVMKFAGSGSGWKVP